MTIATQDRPLARNGHGSTLAAGKTGLATTTVSIDSPPMTTAEASEAKATTVAEKPPIGFGIYRPDPVDATKLTLQLADWDNVDTHRLDCTPGESGRITIGIINSQPRPVRFVLRIDGRIYGVPTDLRGRPTQCLVLQRGEARRLNLTVELERSATITVEHYWSRNVRQGLGRTGQRLPWNPDTPIAPANTPTHPLAFTAQFLQGKTQTLLLQRLA